MLFIAAAIVLVLIVLNGVFAMSEMALVSSRRAKLQAKADRGDAGARQAVLLLDDPTRFLSAVQVGITLIGILAGAYGQATIAAELDAMLETVPGFAPYSELVSTAVVVVVLTYLSLIVGELVPKRLALLFPETISALVARPMSLLTLMLRPFVTLLTLSTAGVLKLFGVRDDQSNKLTHEEVDHMLAEGTSSGVIEPQERAMIDEVLTLGDRPVRVAMTPRRDVYWISLADPEPVMRADIRDCPHSRIVVTGAGGVDEAIGVVHKKHLLDALMDGAPLDVRALMQTPVSLPASATLLSALDQLQHTPVHMAFVVDEFGALQGIITPTDLLEMIAGDFPEDHDAASDQIVRREDGSYLVDGRTLLTDLEAALQERFATDEGYHTVAGLVLHTLGRLPTEGERLQIGSRLVDVVDLDGARIDKLIFSGSEASTVSSSPGRGEAVDPERTG